MKIAIAGSMSFLKEFDEAKMILEKRGHEVIVPKKDPLPEPIPTSIKREAMETFNENLRGSDAILVMNYTKNGKENYIGVNSLMEIGMAFILGKRIFLMNSFPESASHELEAIGAEVLDGNLEKIV